MRFVRIAVVAGLVSALAPFASPAEAAGTVTITGSAPQGYSILMVGKSGNSKAIKGGNFKLKVPGTDAKSASLHLVSSTGKYAGPIVLKFDKKKKTGNTLLSGKTGSLGKIAMKTGYAVAAAKKTTAIATTAKIRVTSAGKPGGAGRMGMPSSTSGASVKVFGVWKTGDGNEPKGADSDKDGLPNTLDLDDDNDGKIDLVDDSNPSKAVTTGSLLFLDISKTINLHAGLDEATMQAALDGVFKSNNNFWIGINMNTAGEANPDGVHISCAADVKWCAPGTPATLFGSGNMNGAAPQKWSDKTADGFALSIPRGDGPNCDDTAAGAMPGGACSNTASTNFNRQFIPQLGGADVQPGSLFTLNLTKGGAVSRSVAGTLSPYFASVPALKEVEVAGQVKAIDYSKKSAVGPAAMLGTRDNPITVTQANKTLKLTFWRPQRSGVSEAGEGKYVDMGGLRYGLYIGVNKVCDAGAFTAPSATLTSSPSADLAHVPLVDSAKDAAPNAANTLSFTVDLAKCEGGGAAAIGNSPQMVTLIASSPGKFDIRAYQDFFVRAN